MEVVLMKAYEMMIENLNKCPGNQMRDTEIREVETDNLDTYVENLHKDKKVNIDKETMNDGSIVYHLDLSGTLIRYTFTEI
jgi:hypothetical protein